MPSMQKLLSIKNLKKHFQIRGGQGGGKAYIRALDGVSLDIYEGETLGLVGESGSGKSTLGRTILRLYEKTSGSTVYYGAKNSEWCGGVDITKLDEKKMRVLRTEMQIIFQDPYSSLNPRMTVGQIIGEGPSVHGYFPARSEQMKDYIRDVMRKCGLPDYMINRYPHEFSGGQRQRICIARALAMKPRFVVCDECVSALDVSIQSQIINLLDELKRDEQLTYLFISHDLAVVRYISDRIGVMYLGNIVELCRTEELFQDPRHPYTVSLLSSIPSTKRYVKKRERIILEGNIPSPASPPSGCKFHTRCFMATEKCKTEVPSLDEISEDHSVACHYKERKITDSGDYLFKL